MILRCKDLYPVYITESFEQQLDVTGDDIKTDIGIFLDKVGSGKDWKLWKSIVPGMENSPLLRIFIWRE